MSENRVTEEAKTVKKSLTHTRGYVLECHLKTTLTQLINIHTHIERYQCNFKKMFLYIYT